MRVCKRRPSSINPGVLNTLAVRVWEPCGGTGVPGIGRGARRRHVPAEARYDESQLSWSALCAKNPATMKTM